MDVVRRRRKGWLPARVSPAGLQVWRVRREMGIAGRRISLRLGPAGGKAWPSGLDSDLEFGFGVGLGTGLRERFAAGVFARSRRGREVRPRSVPELSSELPLDSGTR